METGHICPGVRVAVENDGPDTQRRQEGINQGQGKVQHERKEVVDPESIEGTVRILCNFGGKLNHLLADRVYHWRGNNHIQ